MEYADHPAFIVYLLKIFLIIWALKDISQHANIKCELSIFEYSGSQRIVRTAYYYVCFA